MGQATITQSKAMKAGVGSCVTPSKCFGGGLNDGGCLGRCDSATCVNATLEDRISQYASSAKSQQAALGYENERVLDRYARRLNMKKAEAKEQWIELMRFLALCASTSRPCAPSNKLDQLWHEFILSTKDYAAFCQDILGVYVHHIPSDRPEVEHYQATLTMMEQAYGQINEQVWSRNGQRAADCSGSCKNDDYCDGAREA